MISQVAVVHELLLANGNTSLTCLQVIVGLAPSIGLAGSSNGFISLVRQGRQFFGILDGAVFVLRAASELLVVHREHLVVAHRHFVAGALLSRPLLRIFFLLQLEVGVAALQLSLKSLDLLVNGGLLGFSLRLYSQESAV